MSGGGGEPDEVDPFLGRVVLGRYRIVREVARGGMGAIYLARSEGAASFTKPVVIKRMLPEFVGDEAAARMFKREARIMSLLRHPGIVSVFDFGREDSSYLLVMDYVHGFHLGRWASWTLQQRGEVPVVLAVQIVVQVLEALQYAHALTGEGDEPLRIVHRDVSPSNVLLDVDGHVRLADFGIAQSGADAPDVKTATRTVKGKFSYMAPEILDGADPSPSSDAYAAAVVLHEILVGRNEFRTSNATTTINRVLTHVPTRLDAVRPDCSAELADVIEIALLKSAEERFETAGDLSRALRQVRGVAGEEADAMLAKTLARDFRDRSLASMFELPQLEELERALRAPAPVAPTPPRPRPPPPPPPGALAAGAAAQAPDAAGAPSSRPPPPVSGSIPAPAPGSAPPAARAPSGARRVAVLAALAIAMGGGAALAWQATQPPPPDPEVVYVEASPAGIGPHAAAEPVAPVPTAAVPTATPTDPTPAADPPPVAGDPPTAVDPDPPARAPTKRAPPPAADQEAAAIQRAFARHTEAMHRCFVSAPEGGARELVLRFSVDASGRVDRVDLTPAAEAGTAPGQCVQRIAGAISFPPLAAPRSFRIPIEIRAR